MSAACLMVALAASAFWYSHAATKAAAESQAANESDGVSILRSLAEKAFQENHLVAPIGSNMYEFYLSVLQLDSGNSEALDRLKQAFVPACADVEAAVVRGDLDEADREMRLLQEFDGKWDGSKNHYKLELLGSYLGAQRSLLVKKHEMQARLIQERNAAQGTVSD